MKKKALIISLIIFFVLIIASILFLTSKYALKLNGDDTLEIEVGQDYQEKGAKAILNLQDKSKRKKKFILVIYKEIYSK